MKFIVKVSIEASTLFLANKLRDELAGAVESVRDSGICGETTVNVGDLIELETDRIKAVMQVAEDIYCDDDYDIEIDNDAILSEGEDGPWIQAWLFVPKEKMEKEAVDE